VAQHLKPRSTVVVLYQGDDMDQLAHLKRRVDIAQRRADSGSSAARFGDDDESATAAQAAYDAFVDEAAERALEIELRSIGRRRFRDLLAEHPPRMVESEPDEDGKTKPVVHEDDAAFGVNTEAFPLALLCYRDGDAVTLARPEFASKSDLQRFVDDELADGDFDQLWIAAHMLNRSPSADPKAHASISGSQSTPAT
jgi:hypothetical protein